AYAQQYAHNHKCRQTADKPGQQCGQAPDQRKDKQNFFRPESISQPTAHYLHNQIRISKGGKNEAQYCWRQIELFGNEGCFDCDIYPVYISIEILCTQKTQYHMSGFYVSDHAVSLMLESCFIYRLFLLLQQFQALHLS